MLVNFFVKVALLLLYLIFLVVLLRLLDLSAWYETGFLAAQFVDPLSLSVNKLKLLLEGRGLSYEGVLEREELVALAESTGEIAEGDIGLLEHKSEYTLKQQKSVEFNGRAHFLEEVEDKKDSVWLIQVVPGAKTPLLGSSVWKSVVEKVSIFGIRTGTFICARDIRFCRAKGWTDKPFVLLAMPDGHQYKDHIVSRQLLTASRASGVIDWVNHQLSSKLTEIQNEEELCNHWLEYKSEEETSQSVRTVIFTPHKRPSVLFSALSMQYSGRVKFGYFQERIPKCVDLKPDSKTHLLISTASGTHIYGHRKGEFLNMDSLNLYFHTLVPEINDVFIMTFAIINILCFMDLFLTSGGLAKIFLSFFWQLAKLNLLFILLWLPLLWLFQLPLMATLSNFIWWGVQVLCQTGYVGQLRQDWLMYSHHWKIAGGFFTLYCLVFGWFFKKKCRPQSQEDNLSSVEWLRLIFHQLHLFMVRPRNMVHHSGPQISTNLEEGLDLFMDRPTPDLWLHPVITGEYIHNLPQWKYGGFRKLNHENYGLKDLCSHCQASVQKLFSCTSGKEDNVDRSQELFVKSCKEIHQLFAGPGAKKTAMKAVSDLGTVGDTGIDCTSDHGKEDVVMKQPMSSQSKNEADVNSICQECLDLICQISEESEKEPPVFADNIGKFAPIKKSPDGSDPWPEEILHSSECAICLESYVLGVHLCGLPCGHAFHFDCVQVWLCGGKHGCPTCRWPAFKRKPSKLSKYKE